MALNTGEDIPVESQHNPKLPDPGTERHTNNGPLRGVTAEMRPDEERIHGLMKESTVWDVYNNEARKVDSELVKDWTASLNLLLVFAAIFAAVLTAFIIESKNMLEPDNTEILVDITIQYFNSMGNPSRNNFTRPVFEPTSAAISINCLLFASLGASLVAALASVIALQWVADYDAAITRGGSSPADRAKRRQFRFAGVTRWKMGELIAALPLLLYSSVVLFWAGAIQWMWTLHHTVGYVVAAGTAIAILFYASTTLLGAIYVSSPFRTPLSRGLYWLPLWLLSLVGRFLLWLPIEDVFRFSIKLYQTISSHIRSFVVSDATLDDESSSVSSPDSFPTTLPLLEAVFNWIKTHLLTNGASRNREDETAKQEPALEQECLAWLAQQLPISDDSRERLLLCLSGILALSTEYPASPRFHEAPWLEILEVLSTQFLRQILDPTPSEREYQGVGIVLQCINSPFMRSKVVPAASYIRNPQELGYWGQCCLEDEGVLYFGETGTTPMSFLLARDAPVPSLHSRHELEASWKLIKWRNSISVYMEGSITGTSTTYQWPAIFGDIGRYSPEFFEACLDHFRTWVNVFWRGSPACNYAEIFGSIVEQALHRDISTGEALALARAFAGYLIASLQYRFPETVDEANIIPQPLSYTLAVGRLPESTRATHLAITLLVVRAAQSPVRTEELQWAEWVTFMLWVSIPKERGCLDAIEESIANREGARKLWNEIEMPLTGVAVEGPHLEEIARTWWVNYDVTRTLSRNAFKDPQSLMYMELLFQWAPHCDIHYPGSQHILLHLYHGAKADEFLYANFCAGVGRPENFGWTTGRCNPVLAMLALSDSQDIAYLRFSGDIDLECARRMLGIAKAVKKEPVAFLYLLDDIIKATHPCISPMDLALILEPVKQAMPFLQEESTSFLRSLASELQTLWWHVLVFVNPLDRKGMAAEVYGILDLLRSTYAVSIISSEIQLRLLSCVRSAAVARPAVGWLRMHEPL